MSFSDNTQLTAAIGFNSKQMIFGDPQENTITLGDGKKIKYYRVPVGVKNPDGSVGELVFPTERVFSYGVQENKNDNGKVDGYSMALCMWDRDGATKPQKDWLVGFNSAIDKCKDHILSIKDDVEKYDLEESELKRFNPLYWKREKGKIVEGRGPTLYPKLLVSRKENPPKILTPFENDATGEDMDAVSLIGKYCFAEAAVKIESIFVGSKVSPQVKLYEAVVRPAQSRAKRLLRPATDKKVKLLGGDVTNALGADEDEDEEEEVESDSGSLDGSDDEEEEEDAPPPQPKKKVKKKIVKKRVVRRKKSIGD